jgi:twitching motility protein PilU
MTIAEHIDDYLTAMVEQQASDLYLTYDAPPTLRVGDKMVVLGDQPLADGDLRRFTEQLLTAAQKDEFESTLELNSAISWKDGARFRINMFRQQLHEGLVLRRIQTDIPSIASLSLSPLYADLIMAKRGLVLVVGPTGSGKTTSLAAMVGHRNLNGGGHIITVEDPIEFVHPHRRCIITQRDVGIDTYSFAIALKNALRQRPDVVVIGEIRDREVMEQALYFAETGHLCLATLHANNASQAIERVINFFPEERHTQILLNLSLNLRAILSQRLVTNLTGTRSLIMEIMLNNGLIKQLIEEGKIRQIREMIEKGGSEGMMTFDQCLLKLVADGALSPEIAVAESDNPANLRLQMKQSAGIIGSSAKVALRQAGGAIAATPAGKPSPF